MLRVILLLFAFSVSSTGHTQQLINPSFAKDSLSGWTFTNPAFFGYATDPGYTVSVVRNQGGSHLTAARIASSGNGKWGQLRQNIRYQPKDSVELLRLTGMVKTKGVDNGSAGLIFSAYYKNQTFSASESSLKGTNEWQRVQIDLMLPHGSDSLVVFCSISGEGEAFFDDLKIERLSTSRFHRSAIAVGYLDTALEVIREHALYRDSVDFKTIMKMAWLMSSNAKTPRDTYPAILFALRALGDRHSYFLKPEDTGEPATESELVFAKGKLLQGNIGYINVPSILYGKVEVRRRYARVMQDELRKLDTGQIIGWIVDDRDNRGGQPFPMLTGLGPLLGDGVFNRSQERGRWYDSLSYSNGATIGFDGDSSEVLLQIDSAFIPKRQYPKVAVLINRRAGSAGEMTPLGFKNRPNARLFGEPTGGVSTLSHKGLLSDNAMIVVFTCKMTDRFGTAYGGPIVPDELVADDAATTDDEVLQAAIAWLLKE